MLDEPCPTRIIRNITPASAIQNPFILVHPRQTALSMIAEIRKIHPNMTLVMAGVTNRDYVSQYLNAGADEVLTSEMKPDEVKARIHAVMRRVKEARTVEVEVGNLTIYLDGRLPVCAGRILELTPSEHNIMRILAENIGKPTPRETIYGMLFAGCENLKYERNVDVHISNIRRKLEAVLGSEGAYIKTSRGKGYLLTSS